ncbi:nucleotidyltransferase domain-containing protein [Microbispora bryophytorum]|uniref:nucleotidyltransferase domain-containing protein n=1 Tax=Microbispora bryophytorum TaxID=1460882 RepID=UPI0033EC7876
MDAETVCGIYDYLAEREVRIWIDGGWCVDALLGKQTREHPDLDVAVDHKDEVEFAALMQGLGYTKRRDGDDTAWNYVLTDGRGRSVDVHVFEYDESGKNVYGIAYPYGSLTGLGTIDGRAVGCVAPEWMFTFKTAYTPQDKDREDVHALGERFGFEIPPSHR